MNPRALSAGTHTAYRNTTSMVAATGRWQIKTGFGFTYVHGITHEPFIAFTVILNID